MSESDFEARSRRTKLGLGLRNGLLIGLALALGSWGLQALSPSLAHVRFLYPPLILGSLVLLLLGGLAGILTAWLGSALAGFVVWLGAAALMALVISHIPYDGHNLTVWLADRRSWGLAILPFNASAQVRFWLSGFFIVLLLAILGLFQDYRMEGLEAEVGPNGRLSGRGWLLLLLPLPLVFGAGLIADNIVNSALRGAPGLVQEAINTGRTYRGDLFELSLEKGFNYNAIRGVRDQLSSNYSMQIAEADLGAAQLVFVAAEFDTGAWIYCSVVAGNLSNCYNASPPYTKGLTALLKDGAFPEDCPACRFRVSDELRAWLQAQSENFDVTPQVTRLGQWGSYVLMRVETQANDYAIECRFHGITPVELEDCWEAEGLSGADGEGSIGPLPTLPVGAVESDDPQETDDEQSEAGELRPTKVESQTSGADAADSVVEPPSAEAATAQGTTEAAETPQSTAVPPPASTPTQTSTPTVDAELTRYAAAMRPGFVDELATLGPMTQYTIEITVDPEDAQISGQETVRYVNAASSPQDSVYFRLFPNLPGYGGTMTVSDVRVGDTGQGPSPQSPVSAALEVEGTALRVQLPAPLLPGEGATIGLRFTTTVPLTTGVGYGQLVYLDDVMALANFFPLIPAYDEGNCARFGNCDAGWNIEYAVPYGDAVFSETALFDVFVNAPEEWTVVASGSTIETTADANGTVTWHIVSGPMRDFNVVLSPRFEVATRQVDDILVNSYFVPEDAEGGRRVLRWSADALALFNQLFGPYPYAELDAVAAPTVAPGIEYPGLIVLAARTYDDTTGRFQWTTAHEVAHQWWYSLVGNDQQDEPWLDEALTQYSTALYYELVERWDEAVTAVLEPRYQQVAGTEEDDLISQPVAAYTESNYGPVVYGKGPLFFHALRQEMGDEAFYAFLASYFNTYRYKVAGGADLLRLAEQVWGWDLADLYQEWLGAAAGIGP